jgi:hypothetical protein
MLMSAARPRALVGVDRAFVRSFPYLHVPEQAGLHHGDALDHSIRYDLAREVAGDLSN